MGKQQHAYLHGQTKAFKIVKLIFYRPQQKPLLWKAGVEGNFALKYPKFFSKNGPNHLSKIMRAEFS